MLGGAVRRCTIRKCGVRPGNPAVAWSDRVDEHLFAPRRRAAGVAHAPGAAAAARSAPAGGAASRPRARRRRAAAPWCPGRGEYMKTNRPSKPTASTRRNRGLEVRLGLAGIAHDHVAGQRQVGPPVAQERRLVQVGRRGRSRAASRRGCGRSPTARAGAGTDRAAAGRGSASAIRCDDVLGMRRREAQPLQPGHRVRRARAGPRSRAVVVGRRSRSARAASPRDSRAPTSSATSATISSGRPADLRPARARHDAEAADVVAALHRRDVRADRAASARSSRWGWRRCRPCDRDRRRARPCRGRARRSSGNAARGCGCRRARRRRARGRGWPCPGAGRRSRRRRSRGPGSAPSACAGGRAHGRACRPPSRARRRC